MTFPTHPHVVIDARMVTAGGIGTYLQALVPRVARLRSAWRFTFLGDVAAMRYCAWDGIGNASLVHTRAKIFGAREQIQLPFQIPRDADLYWAPHYNVPALVRHPLVVTIHDLNHLALPELMGGATRRGAARVMLRSAVGRAKRVLFDSQFTRREAQRLLGIDSGQGDVVYAAVEGLWSNARRDFPRRPMSDPYFLYVGNFKRHKNVPFLLRAFQRIRNEVPHRMVLIGRREGLQTDAEIAAMLPVLGDRAIALGEVAPALLREYVAHADALVTASLYEGFGLPPLEAMAAGCPCVVSTAGAFPEICGEAALYADPTDEDSFAARLLEIVRSPSLRADLIERGRARAAEFDWDRSAQLAADVLTGALS